MYNLIHTGHMCAALAETGIATWNVEYRSVGDVGGGWPGTGDDVARAVEFVDELAGRYPLDRERVALVGHSAGGHLALWAAKRTRLPVVALAPVSDLRESAQRVGPDGAVARFVGGMPGEQPERYAEASPRELLPLGVRQMLVHGTEDRSRGRAGDARGSAPLRADRPEGPRVAADPPRSAPAPVSNRRLPQGRPSRPCGTACF